MESWHLEVLNEVYLQNFLHGWIVHRETNLMNLINSSLEIVYCSTTLSNHGLIRLKRFVSKLHRGYGMGFVSYSHLILLISGQIFEITVVLKLFWNFGGN